MYLSYNIIYNCIILSKIMTDYRYKLDKILFSNITNIIKQKILEFVEQNRDSAHKFLEIFKKNDRYLKTYL